MSAKGIMSVMMHSGRIFPVSSPYHRGSSTAVVWDKRWLRHREGANTIADGISLNVWRDRDDIAAGLMTKRALRKLAMQVFMQIRPADAAIPDFDLYFPVPWRRVWNFLNPDVPYTVINCFFYERLLSDC